MGAKFFFENWMGPKSFLCTSTSTACNFTAKKWLESAFLVEKWKFSVKFQLKKELKISYSADCSLKVLFKPFFIKCLTYLNDKSIF